jgi:putative peptide maturation system protein
MLCTESYVPENAGMASLSEYIAIEVNGETISLRDVLRFAKWHGRATFIKDAADAALIRQAAVERGLKISDEEFQQAADAFRVERELYDAETTEEWLAANYLSNVEWEALLEDDLLRRKLSDALTGGSVEKYFAEQRFSFDAAAISRLVLKEEGVARELRAQIAEDGADFYALARKYSCDAPTRPAGGYSGLVRRSEMEAVMEATVFGAQPGTTVGPIKTYDGWELVKVEALHPATLDDAMRESIKSLLFTEWLNDRRLKAKISVPLLEREAEEAEPATKSSA